MFPARCSGIQYFLMRIAKVLLHTTIYGISLITCRIYLIWILLSMYWIYLVQSNRYHAATIFNNSVQYPLPVFSFSTTPANADIMYPAWTFWEVQFISNYKHARFMTLYAGRPCYIHRPFGHRALGLETKCVDTKVLSCRHKPADKVYSAAKWPWIKKHSKAFFRGTVVLGVVIS